MYGGRPRASPRQDCAQGFADKRRAPLLRSTRLCRLDGPGDAIRVQPHTVKLQERLTSAKIQSGLKTKCVSGSRWSWRCERCAILQVFALFGHSKPNFFSGGRAGRARAATRQGAAYGRASRPLAPRTPRFSLFHIILLHLALFMGSGVGESELAQKLGSTFGQTTSNSRTDEVYAPHMLTERMGANRHGARRS